MMKRAPEFSDLAYCFGSNATLADSVIEPRPASPGAIFRSSVMDVTLRGPGRMQIAEVCLHEVKGGKIVSEQFCGC